MNRLLQVYFRGIINGSDNKYTENSTDEKLFPLACNSQITTTLGLSQYEMVCNQKPPKNRYFSQQFPQKMHKIIVTLQRIILL